MDYQYYDEGDYLDDEDGHFQPNFLDGSDLDDHAGDYIDGHFQSLTENFLHSYRHCVLPSISQVLLHLLPLIMGCFVARLLSALYTRRARLVPSSNCVWLEGNRLEVAPVHIINALCGASILYGFVGNRILIVLGMNVISYLLLQVLRLQRKRGVAIAIAVICIGSQFIYELTIWQEDSSEWRQIRGFQMLNNMKTISVAFDLTAAGSTHLAIPSPFAFAGYTLNPGNCALGPWLSYTRYMESVHQKTPLRRSLCLVAINVLIGLGMLTLSNCIAPTIGEMIAPESQDALAVRKGGLIHWLSMYTGSVSVRSSHYFVSFFAQAYVAAAGQQLDTRDVPGSDGKKGLDLIANPLHIEWPRSLSALCRSWNIPMHIWFKRYVHTAPKQELRSRHRTGLAMFATFLVSSLLHGMDFRIYLALLSMGIFAAGEAMLRRHLAGLFNACIAENPCRGAKRCCYARCPQRLGWLSWNSLLVRLVNLGFTLLALCHLAYLSVVLVNDTLALGERHELPFLHHWSAAGFLCHYVGIGMFAVYMFIT